MLLSLGRRTWWSGVFIDMSTGLNNRLPYCVGARSLDAFYRLGVGWLVVAPAVRLWTDTSAISKKRNDGVRARRKNSEKQFFASAGSLEYDRHDYAELRRENAYKSRNEVKSYLLSDSIGSRKFREA